MVTNVKERKYESMKYESMKYESMKTESASENNNELFKALLIANEEFSPAAKSAHNNHRDYDYSTIGDIYTAVKASLHKNNIFILHHRYIEYKENEGGFITFLDTRLIHQPSGQWIKDLCIIVADKEGNQGVGAAITYMRKQAVLLLCAVPSEDIDSEKERIKDVEKKPNYEKNNQSKQYNTITRAQAQKIEDAVGNHAPVRERILSSFEISHYSQLKPEDFRSVIDYINKVTKGINSNQGN